MSNMASARRQFTESPGGVFQDDQVFTPSLLAQLSSLLLQPGSFFRSLRHARWPQRWLWVALLILLVLAFGAVQQAGQNPTSTGDAPVVEMPMGPGVGPFEAPFSPEDGGLGAAQSKPADSWTIAVKAASTQIAHWALLALILAEISMLHGRAPRLGLNLQIAIWTSVPLALMTLVQLLYLAAGGSIGKAGLSGLLETWAGFADWNLFLRSFAHGLASNLTLFWLWSLTLIYIAGRQTLHGKRAAVIAVLAAWIIVMSIGSGVQSYKAFAIQQPQVVEMAPEPNPAVDGPMESVSGPAANDAEMIAAPEVNLP